MSLIGAARVALLEEGRELALDELSDLAALPEEQTPLLAALAHEVRLARCGPTVELESILSARTGGCPEDCAFCAQSSKFNTPVKPAVLNLERIVEAARDSARLGVSEFCIVAAVRGPDRRLMDSLLQAIASVREATGLNVAVSAGILTEEQAHELAGAGLHRYNHNLETARSFFPQIVTTHSWKERFDTCLLVKQAGMELCCGAIIGLGESTAQRIELLGDLRSVAPAEIPINFLNPRPGTPLADRPLVGALEAIRWIALFRLALPEVILRYAGGREVTLRELQAMGMTAGINALIVGNYLTTLGRSPEQDLTMVQDLRMPIGSLSKVI
ncbi:MAG: biotin synthase BioB [Actinomycetota bacterium]